MYTNEERMIHVYMYMYAKAKDRMENFNGNGFVEGVDKKIIGPSSVAMSTLSYAYVCIIPTQFLQPFFISLVLHLTFGIFSFSFVSNSRMRRG